MDTQNIKLDLIRWLAALEDVKILRQVLSLKEAQIHEVRSQILPGEPMTIDEFRSRIASAQTSVRDGNYTTMEDLEREMEEW